MAKNSLLFNEIGKLEKAWRNFGRRPYKGWILGDSGKMAWWAGLYLQMSCAGENMSCKPFSAELILPTPLLGESMPPFLAPTHGTVVMSGRNSENSTSRVLKLERLIYVAMLTASYMHSLAKHQSRHQLRRRREVRRESVVIWRPDVLRRKEGYFRWWEIQWRKWWCGRKRKTDRDVH